jgi:hypothetical protein
VPALFYSVGKFALSRFIPFFYSAGRPAVIERGDKGEGRRAAIDYFCAVLNQAGRIYPACWQFGTAFSSVILFVPDSLL